MKILVTGSAGFIGYHLCQALLARGDTVIGLDNFNAFYDPSLKRARNDLLQRHGNFTAYEGDICDRTILERTMKGTDRVCHLAAVAGVRYAFDHPEEYVRSNINGFFSVLDVARRLDIPGLIYASSSSVYGGNDKLPASETDRVDKPVSLYAQNKRENELMAFTYHSLYGLPVTGLRFFTVYGPYGRPDMALFIFTKAILEDTPLPVFGEGKMQRDWTYIDDIVAGTIAAIEKNYPCELFNLGCGRKEELTDFIGMIEKECGKEAKKEFLPMQPGDVRSSLADISHAREKLGYEPKTTIAEGIPKFVAWYREYYGV